MFDKYKDTKSYRKTGKFFKLSGGTIHKLLHRWCNMYKPEEKIPSGYITLDEYCNMNGIYYSNLYYHIQKKSLPITKVNRKIYIHMDTIIVNKKFLTIKEVEEIMEYLSYDLAIKHIAKLTGHSRKTIKLYKEIFYDK